MGLLWFEPYALKFVYFKLFYSYSILKPTCSEYKGRSKTDLNLILGHTVQIRDGR